MTMFFPSRLGIGRGATDPAATFVYTAGSEGVSSSTLTTYTFTVTLDATADHHIFMVAGGNGSSGSRTISSVTIDGQAATELAFHEASTGTTYHQIGLYIATATGASSGNVVVTWSAAQGRCCCLGGAAFDLNSTTPTNAAYDDSGTTLSQSIDVSAGGFAVAAAFAISNTTCTWAGLTERQDANATISRCRTMASADFASAQTGLTVSATFAATNVADLMVIAAMR